MSTGVRALDRALAGGYIRGRLVEVYGPEGGGKSTLAYHAIAVAQREGFPGVWGDAEGQFSDQLAQALGVDPDAVVQVRRDDPLPDHDEDMVDQLVAAAGRPDVGVVVVDSVATLRPENAGMIGAHASLVQDFSRRLLAAANSSGCVVILTNQLRTGGIGGPGGTYTTTTGGRALRFAVSQRIKVGRAAKSWRLESGGEVIGQRVRFTVEKNRLGPPFREAAADLIYGSGFDATAALLAEALAAGVVEKNRTAHHYFAGAAIGHGTAQALKRLADDAELVEAIEAAVAAAGGTA